MTRTAKLLIASAIVYLLITIGTAQYVWERTTHRGHVQGVAFVVGVVWPIYWTVRLANYLSNPDPLPPLEDDR